MQYSGLQFYVLLSDAFLDYPALKVDRVEIIDILLNLCTYHHPENIALPKG
jgi:hypothetical protein